MKCSKEAVIQREAYKLARKWAAAFALSEDEAHDHLCAVLTLAWDGLEVSRDLAVSGAMRRETTIKYSARVM